MTARTTTTLRTTAAVMDTPAGQLALLSRGGRLCASGFTALPALAARLGLDAGELSSDDGGDAAAAMRDYLDGDLAALDRVVVEQPGGPFRQAAWLAMRAVAPGTTLTYTGLASRAGSPQAVRAAGTACGLNLLAPFVPCHRVLRTDGSLGGYRYGLAVKQWLLDHEGATPRPIAIALS